MPLALVVDVGGTNTRVALAEGCEICEGSVTRFSNAEYKARGQNIEHILRNYLHTSGAQIESVCVAAAGLVQDNLAAMTNLDWCIDDVVLARATGLNRVSLINDLQAQGYALGHIADSNLTCVMNGMKKDGGAMLVVGLGTGMNAAPVHEGTYGRIVAPSECGHVGMPVRSPQDLRLMQFIEERLRARGEVAHCSVEEVLSGRGLINLYAFAAAERGQEPVASSAAVMAALAQNDEIAVQSAQLYTQILARCLADLALIHLPYGGIYLIGGMARGMAPYFERFGLCQTFREARRINILEKAFAINVVEDDYAALIGCAAYLHA